MPAPIFVSGATGVQGGAITRHLHKAGIPVHAFTRDPTSTQAQALSSLDGVTLFPGTFDEEATVTAAMRGCSAAFLNFNPSFTDMAQEGRHARTAIAASRAAGVKHLVYAAALGLLEYGKGPNFQGCHKIVEAAMTGKTTILDAVAGSGAETWAAIMPGKFMGDFLAPRVDFMFGGFRKTGVFTTALRREDVIPLTDPEDIGRIGAAVLTDPARFNGQHVDIFTELVTPEGLVEKLAAASGKKLSARILTEEEVREKRGSDLFIDIQVVMRDTPFADLDKVKALGFPLGSFEEFLEKEKDALDATFADVPASH